MKIQKILLLLILSTATILSACEHSIPSDKDDKPQQNSVQKPEMEHSQQILEDLFAQAQKGMVKNCPFTALDSTINQVKTEWGEPDQVDQAGLGYYATYSSKHIVFGYNEAGEIFDVRSFAIELHKLTYDQMMKTLGPPNHFSEVDGDSIYVYQPTPEIQLKIIIPKSETTIDHINVFSTKRGIVATKNDYILEIKGVSNQLTKNAWESMQAWRNQIISFSRSQENVYINGPNQQKVALTFDDGPDMDITPDIINILARYHVKGNFFFIGSKVKEHPDVVKNAFDHGNLVLSHSYNHVELTKLSNESIRNELEKAGEAISSITGKEPAIVRTPYGDTDTHVAVEAKQAGYSIVLWSIDTLDWSQKESQNILNNVLDNVRNGDIILMHSDTDKSETKKALPQLIEELQKRDFAIVGLDELLNIKAYQ
ncbi:polysaccharide deacetylase family protein [Neobacillus jeddahensis]|uniref:polysaccharide deacetylase family protein n=1 Tax=Neobacillus jeddahensis TaxID=1461580 RepID=UPI0006937DF4|nr:polysaccharide deacetylase family protein [Neobacillus jeddahensis]